jgi:hypothetical protein
MVDLLLDDPIAAAVAQRKLMLEARLATAPAELIAETAASIEACEGLLVKLAETRP